MGQKLTKSEKTDQPVVAKYNLGRKIINGIPAVPIECNLLDEDDVVVNLFYIRFEREIHQFLDYTSYTYVLKSYIYSEYNKITTDPANYKFKKDCFLPDSLVGLYHRDKSIFVIKRTPIPVPVPVPVPAPAPKTANSTADAEDAPPAYQDSSAKP